MSRRIEIELTSTRPDGTWTWRASGAKEPRGVLDGGLLHEGAKTGDVLKAEADFEIEGITIISVAPPKTSGRSEPDRIEVIGPQRTETPGVTTQLVGRSDRRGPSRRREGGEGRPRPDRQRDAVHGPDRRNVPGGGSERAGRPERAGGPERSGRPERPERTGSPARAGRPAGGDRQDGSDRPPRRERRERPERDGQGTGQGGAPRAARTGPRREAGHGQDHEQRGADRAKRLSPGHVHRQAILDSLASEQKPIAEQVLRGGIPAVRTALHLEREKAAAEGRPTPNTDQLIAMAEDLLPKLKAAEWRDRAEAASKAAEEISIRDLRSVVAGSDAARDDETRELAASLREALERRVGALKEEWAVEIAKHLDEGRVVRALRLSARPPEPAARLEDEMASRLSDAAGEAMSAATEPDRWMALLDAAAASPVRRTIKPSGLPPEPTPELKQAALQQSGRIPALATMLGVSIPPPPVPAGRRPPPRKPAASD